MRISILADDMLFCIRQLEQLNKSIFQNRIDFSSIGAWGYSIGGATAMEASIKDPLIKAVMNMDGTPPFKALQEGIRAHFLFLEDLTDYKNHQGYRKQFGRKKNLCEKVIGDAYRILIEDIKHNSFSDIPYHGAETSEQKEKSLKVLTNCQFYLSDFFNHYLNNGEGTLDWKEQEGLEIFPC